MKKVLVRGPQWLGDAVVSTVFLSRLKAQNPEIFLTVLTPAALTDIFSTHPSVDSVLPIQKSQSPFSVAALVRPHGFDTIYILPRSFRTALEAWWSRIPVRIGFPGDLRRFFLTEPIPYEPRLRYAHRYLKLIGEETLPLIKTLPTFPSKEPGPENKDIFNFFTNAPRPILGVGPASVAPSRTWEAARFCELAQKFLKERGGSVVLFGSPQEKSVTADLAAQFSGSVLDTAGRLNFPELGWAVKQCDQMVVNDSGLMHVASCFQIPTVVLFGASDPTWALPPWGSFEAIQHKEVPCVPCLKNNCVRFGDGKNECMKKLSVQEVWDAISK